MCDSDWHIYLEEVPVAKDTGFWVSFESDPRLKKTKEGIYGRCLPCIQDLYYQLKRGQERIALGRAYNCWKVTAVVNSLEDCFSLLLEFEKRHPVDHVHGKLGTGRPEAGTKVVVFHTDDIEKRELIREALGECALRLGNVVDIQISRGCATLYEELLGDWREWSGVTQIRYPEKVERILKRIKKILYWS